MGTYRAGLAPELLRVTCDARDAGELIDGLLEAVGRGTGWHAAAYWTVDLTTGALRRTHAWTATPAAAGAARSGCAPGLDGPARLCEEARTSGYAVWRDLVEGDGLGGAGTVCACPILSGSSVVGVVELSSDAVRPHDAGLVDDLRQLGSDLGSLLRRFLDEEDQRRDVQRLRAAEGRQRLLAEVSRVLAGSAGCKAMLAQLAALLVPRVGDACAVHLLDDRGQICDAAAAAEDLRTAELTRAVRQRYPPRRDDHEGVGRVLRTGASVLYPSVTDALLAAVSRDEEHHRLLRAVRPTSMVVVPLPGRGAPAGALSLTRLGSAPAYGPDDLSVMEELGRRVGMAVVTAQLYDRERAVASALQRSLLPPALPRLPSVDLAARFHPGGEGLSVGGDFYDVFAGDGDTWFFGIGDVRGFGVEAATVTARVRYSARAVAGHASGPAALLRKVNRLIMGEEDEPRFCTAVYGTLSPIEDGAAVAISCAGHPAPLLRRSSGAVEAVGAAGTLLGVVDDPELDEETVTLSPGDLLVLYTDGIVEARQGRTWFGDERLRDLVSCEGWRDADALAEHIQRAVVAFCGGRVDDDIAVLVLRIRDRGGRAAP